jgi:hypothetical protein
MDGTAAIGSETAYAAGNHVHPSDTSKVTANAAITGATKTKITYDGNGLVTDGTDLAATDLPQIAVAASTANTDAGTAAKTDTLANLFGWVREGLNYLKQQAGLKFTLPGSGTTAMVIRGDGTLSTAGTASNFRKGDNSVAALAASDIPELAQSKITNLAADLSGKVSKAGDTMTGALTLSGAPTSDLHAATKAYVDAAIQGLDIKASCKVATTANINLTGATASIDGITLAVGDRVLVKNQTTGSQNGIYTVTAITGATAWTRTPDFNSSANITDGAFTFVEQGTANADTGWVMTTNGAITVGTTALAFTQFSGAGVVSVIAGTGIGVAKDGTAYTVSIPDQTIPQSTATAAAGTAAKTASLINLFQWLREGINYVAGQIPTANTAQKANLASTNGANAITASEIGVTGTLPIANGGTGQTIGPVAYGTVATAVGTAAKVGTLANFVRHTGSVVGLKFTAGNNVAPTTLNVNSTGAANMRWQNAALTAAMIPNVANHVSFFQFDGTDWQLLNPAHYSTSSGGTSLNGTGYVKMAGATPSYDAKVLTYADKGASVNFNDVVDSGVYRIQGSSTNSPNSSTNSSWTLAVFGGNSVMQFATYEGSSGSTSLQNNVYFRRRNYNSTASSAVWSDWAIMGSGGGGTLTGITQGTGITVTASATSPTVALTTPVAVANGGTGLTSIGNNKLVRTNSSGAVSTIDIGSSTTTYLRNDGSWATPAGGSNISTPVSIANGGTGQTTAEAALSALLTTLTVGAGGTEASPTVVNVPANITNIRITPTANNQVYAFYCSATNRVPSTIRNNTNYENIRIYSAETSDASTKSWVGVMNANGGGILHGAYCLFNPTYNAYGPTSSLRKKTNTNSSGNQFESGIEVYGLTVSTANNVATPYVYLDGSSQAKYLTRGQIVVVGVKSTYAGTGQAAAPTSYTMVDFYTPYSAAFGNVYTRESFARSASSVTNNQTTTWNYTLTEKVVALIYIGDDSNQSFYARCCN